MQCRTARLGLRISQKELAKRAGISRPTVGEFEREARGIYPRTAAALVRAFEEAGVTFIDDGQDGGTRGVGWRIIFPQ